MANKIIPLHYLRGLAALGIMLHHYFGHFSSAGHLHERVGIYGVSLFYILSGITLYHVYHSRVWQKGGLKEFYIRRFFRIYPLMWLAIVCTLVLGTGSFSVSQIALNFTGLFGFLDSSAGIPTGSWSIGNELVFYSLFPFALLLLQSGKRMLEIIFLALSASLLYYSCVHLEPSQILDKSQWNQYIQPLNQAYLFLFGMWLGFRFGAMQVSTKTSVALLTLGTVFLLFFPLSGDSILLITGWNRLWFSIAALLICLGAYKLNFQFKGLAHSSLYLLGSMSYSLYLLHPIVADTVVVIESFFFESFDIYWLGFIATPIALIVAAISYRYFEKPFILRGRKVHESPAI